MSEQHYSTGASAGTLQGEADVAEADRLGFERIFVSKYNSRSIDRGRYGIDIVSVGVIEEAFRALFA